MFTLGLRRTLLASSVLAFVSVPGAQIRAQSVAPPDFSPSSNVGWVAYGDEFIPPVSGPAPVSFDPQHPFIPDCIGVQLSGDPARKCSDKPATFRIADLNSPILQPWTKEEVRKRNEQVL